jgi:cell wall-associated NlpC family hydrolase
MKIKEYSHKVDREPLPGDIIVFEFPGSKVPHHAAICISDEFIIHSLTKQGVVLSNRKGYKQYEVGTYCYNGWKG